MRAPRPVDIHAQRVAAGAAVAGPAPDRPGGQRRPGTGELRRGLHALRVGRHRNPRRPARGRAGPQGGGPRRDLCARASTGSAERDSRPLKAEFYALSGRLLKTARYEEFSEMAGAMRPTRLVMEDALKKGEVSVLTYENMNVRDLPEAHVHPGIPAPAAVVGQAAVARHRVRRQGKRGSTPNDASRARPSPPPGTGWRGEGRTHLVLAMHQPHLARAGGACG